MKVEKFLLFFLVVPTLVLAFDLGTYSNSIKSNVGNAEDVKNRLKKELGYDPDSAARNPESIPNQNPNQNAVNRIIFTAYCQSLSGGYVCPVNMTKCDVTPVCPPGGSYNAQTGKCEAASSGYGKGVNVRSSTAWVRNGSDMRGIKVYMGKEIEAYAHIYCAPYRVDSTYNGGPVNILGRGRSEYTHICGYDRFTYGFEIRNGKLRTYKFWQPSTGRYRNYYGSWIPLCPKGGGSSDAGGEKIETTFSNGKNYIRYCYRSSEWICGDWVEYICGPSCPSGYTYNSSRGICEADPNYSYSCPFGNYQCVEDSPGVAYCSPHSCSQSVNGVSYCEGSWERIDMDSFLQSFTSQDYCFYERKCKSRADVSKNGGMATCRIYYDTLKPGCANNPNQAKCVTDDCGDLFKYCTLKNYVPYGDIPDKVNQELSQYCDPVSGMCGMQSVPGKSGVNLGTYTFECPSDVRKVCTQWEVVKKCPNGTTSFCTQVSTCKAAETKTLKTTETRSCVADRVFTEHRVVKNSQEDENYKNNPLCVKVGDVTEKKQVKGMFSWGWDGDWGDKCNSCESYVTGLWIENPNGGWFEGSGACYKVSGSPGVFPSESQLRNFFNDYFNNKVGDPTLSIVSVDLSHATKVGEGGNNANPYDRECFGDNGGQTDNRDYEVPITLSITYSVYRCYTNQLDTSSCSNFSNCTPVSDPSNLSELPCYRLEHDVENGAKAVCSRYSILYECPATKHVTNCTQMVQEIRCDDGSVVIPNIQAFEKDFSQDFLQAVGLAQATNELKHVWTGKAKQCDDGWWNSIVENPTQYFINKAVSAAVAQFGSWIATSAQAYFEAASFCLDPSSAVYGVDGIKDCMATIAESSYTDKNSPRYDFVNTVCNHSQTFCGAAEFLSDPVVSFAVSVAVDIITTTNKCNACTSESCAVKHGQYETYALVNGRQCHFVASKCTWKIDLGFTDICLRRGYKYCCYDSVFTRILVEQAYKQLGYSWGSWGNPNCGALTFEDLKRLDFSAMDFSELREYIEHKMKTSIPEEFIKNKIEQFYRETDPVAPSLESPYGKTN